MLLLTSQKRMNDVLIPEVQLDQNYSIDRCVVIKT